MDECMKFANDSFDFTELLIDKTLNDESANHSKDLIPFVHTLFHFAIHLPIERHTGRLV